MSADPEHSNSEEEVTKITSDWRPPYRGKVMVSPITGNRYRVIEWEHVEDNKFVAKEKELIGQ